jgi:hypothetical protein
VLPDDEGALGFVGTLLPWGSAVGAKALDEPIFDDAVFDDDVVAAVVDDPVVAAVVPPGPPSFEAQLHAKNVTNPTPLALRNHMADKCAERRHRSPNQWA